MTAIKSFEKDKILGASIKEVFESFLKNFDKLWGK